MRTPLLLAFALIVGLGLWFLSRSPDRGAPSSVDVTRIDGGSGPGTELDSAAPESLTPSGTDAPARTNVPAVPLREANTKLVVGGRVLVIPEGGTKSNAQPMEGLAVEIGPAGPPLATTTDRDGRFRLLMNDRGVRPVSCLLTVQGGERLVTWSRRIDFAAGVRSVDDLLIYLQSPPAATGTVRTPTGRPVQGMSLSIPGGGKPALSDAGGAFTLADVPKEWFESPHRFESELTASKKGASVLSIDAQGFDGDEVWQPILIVAAETGTLEITAAARSGTPCPGLSFSVNVSPDERYGAGEQAVFGFQAKAQTAVTNDVGVAHFSNVPTGVNLKVVRSGIMHEAIDENGVLLDNDAAPKGAVRPLRASTVEDTRVRYLVDVAAVLKGRVFEPDGQPSAGARLVLRTTDHEVEGSAITPRGATAEEDGSFEIPYTLVGTAQRISVRAQSTNGEEPSLSMFGGTKLPDPLLCAFAEVDVVPSGAELELRLVPMGKMTGEIVGPGGEPTDYVQLRILPDDESSSPFDFTLLTGRANSISTSTGSFEIKAIPPGSYTLEARSRVYGTIRRSGIAHDAKGVVLRYGQPDLARVTLTASGPADIQLLSVATGTLQVNRRVRGVQALDRTSTYSSPLGYQGAVLNLSSGVATFTADGLTGRTTVNSAGGSSKTLELAPGEYWLGVRATDVNGNALFPMGTGPVRVEAGEHKVHFEMVRTASLTGHRSKASASGEAWVAEIHIPGGDVVPCIGARNGMQSSFRLGSDGSFGVRVLPARPLEVWIGTRFNLAARRPDIVRKITPAPGETLAITID